MTEEIASTPGWVDEKLDELFSRLPSSPEVGMAREAYSSCLARRKAPAAISDQLGAEFTDCRSALLRSLRGCHENIDIAAFGKDLEALEAEIDGNS